MLAAFLGYIEPWEALVRLQLEPVAADLGDRRKVHLLRQDLDDLGLTPSEVELIPRCERLPAIDSLAAAIGSMYVLEGSTLGGQILSRHTARLPGLSDGRGGAYFRSYGSEVGEKWREFGRVAELAVPPALHAAAVESALETFETFAGWVSAARMISQDRLRLLDPVPGV